MTRQIAVSGAMAGLAATGAAVAQPTFGVSPGGASELSGSVIYTPAPGGGATPVGGGPGIGALSPDDDVDDYSEPEPDDDFIVILSVDPLTIGTGPPGPLPPFRVFDQAANHQHAADAFIVSEAYNRLTGRIPAPVSTGLFTNFLETNQSAPYDRDFRLLPAGGPAVNFPPGTPGDDVDGLGRLVNGQLPPLYYTLARGSPSIATIAGGVADSGADIFFDPVPNQPGTEQLFASQEQLGLIVFDDIDALVVYDLNHDGAFNGQDQVLFSLARNSPSLQLLNVSAADLLSKTVGPQPPQPIVRFNHMALLFNDDVDACRLVKLEANSADQTIRWHTTERSRERP